MIRAAATVLLFATIAVAAPVPKTDPTELAKKFGTPADPDKDCTFALDGDKLTIGVPAKHHTLTSTPTNRNAPRVLKAVTGDFTATVRVKVSFPEDPKSDLPGLDPAAGAGILVWKDVRNYAAVEQVHSVLAGRGKLTDPEFHTVKDGEDGESHSGRPEPFDAAPIYLKLERTGDVLKASASADGDVWRVLMKTTLPLGKTVQVGVFAGHNAGAAVTATFDKFVVK